LPKQSKELADNSNIMQDDDQELQTATEQHVHRIEVQPLTIPWQLAYDDPDEIPDPVPSEIRRRYSDKNKALRLQDPMGTSTPFFTVPPGEDMLWDVVEVDALNRLRTGTIVTVKPSQVGNFIIAKIESTEGIIERGYVRFEGLINDRIYDLFGDMYSFRRGVGDVSRRAAAAYEIAKAAGFDDLVPPTVYRCDQHNGLEPVLSTDAVEQFSDVLGIKKEQLPELIGNSAAIELWNEDTTCLCETLDFSNILNNPELINNFYSNLNDIHKMALLRAAVYDFLVWNGSRTWMEVLACPSDRHPLHLVNNNIVLPDPIALGVAYLDYQNTYGDGCPVGISYMPMLWSDPVMMAALRGFEEEAEIYNNIGYACGRRLQGQRVVELIRSLNDHGISQLATAGMLVRAAFLRFGAHVVMRDPLVVARYFSSIITGDIFEPGFDIDLDAMVDSINKAMNKSIYADFDFIKYMTGADPSEKEEQEQELATKEFDGDYTDRI
jgi:hypothetical protein